jgi:hypothetical protein
MISLEKESRFDCLRLYCNEPRASQKSPMISLEKESRFDCASLSIDESAPSGNMELKLTRECSRVTWIALQVPRPVPQCKLILGWTTVNRKQHNSDTRLNLHMKKFRLRLLAELLHENHVCHVLLKPLSNLESCSPAALDTHARKGASPARGQPDGAH